MVQRLDRLVRLVSMLWATALEQLAGCDLGFEAAQPSIKSTWAGRLWSTIDARVCVLICMLSHCIAKKPYRDLFGGSGYLWPEFCPMAANDVMHALKGDLKKQERC